MFLRGLPRAVPPLVVAGLVAVGLLASGVVAIACLAVVLALFAWLLFLSWPALPAGARGVRIVVLAIMVLGIALKMLV